ncbi:cAMP-regulated D2 protein-like [Seriola lalandi dorsalis]|uniref:Carboxylic ester hydrolase n=1 Tax=Seriola lalandi dorsalis TaxID=1841481 RepID=A0A3B4X695_SERLL|nr:cAMP-regulated D2 protein-like [Seriola lalandi dorsalis]XP_056223863.1 cAMP-regulated D2 protein [Seriola aureovittata]
MESWHCLLLLCTLSLVLASGEETKNDDDIDLVSFLRRIYPGLLVRDEPLVINRHVEINSPKEPGRPEVHSITEQTKDKPVSQDTNRAPGPLVLTKDGQIKGITVDKAHIFYGIPYADPPVGAYRWKPPRPVSPWSGVYNASFPRPACMQACSGPSTEECPRLVSEDCLYLNIFVPLDVNFSSPLRSPLPVMVWIHGGDFIAGSASKPLYDGRFISNFTRTVLVSMEYRLGAFGFLVSGKDLHTSAAGNYGILDQQEALLWVQRNIAVFGGDPSKVTIFGESAGAQSVSLHLMIQSSKPLFKQAVLQSLPFSIPLKTRHDALKLGKNFAKQTNCSVSDIVCLLSLTPQAVLTAQMKTSSKIVNPFRFLEVFETWGPYIDGDLIKEQAVAAFQKGHWQKEKPVLLGTTSEEGVIFVYGVFNKPVSAVECTVYITAIFKQHALRILHKYLPLYRDADRRDMLAQIVTDYVFLCPSRRSARAGTAVGSKLWMYVFDHTASDHRVWSGLTFCYQHACHGAELPFLFDSAAVANFTLMPSEKLLSNRMLCYWGAFAHTGDPSSRVQQTTFCREQRLPVWPRYSDTSGWLVMNLTVRSHAQVGTRNHMCDFWDQLGIY